MNYTSVDRGVFTYQADALNLSVGLDPTSMTSLNLSVKTTQGVCVCMCVYVCLSVYVYIVCVHVFV